MEKDIGTDQELDIEILEPVGIEYIENGERKKRTEQGLYALDGFQKATIIAKREFLSPKKLKELEKKVRQYQNAVGVDFYNLEQSDDARKQFYLKYGVGAMFFEESEAERYKLLKQSRDLQNTQVWDSDEDAEAGFTSDVDRSILANAWSLGAEQTYFNPIIDKVTAGGMLSLSQIDKINKRLTGETRQIRITGTERWKLTRDLSLYRRPLDNIFRAAYEWLLLVSQGVIVVGKCAAQDCDNVFIPYNSGKGQRFCSARCRSRIHKRRKMVKVDV